MMDHTSLKPPHLPVIAERNPFLYYPFIAATPFLSLPISSTHSDGLSSPKSLHSPAIISPRFSNSSAQSQNSNFSINRILDQVSSVSDMMSPSAACSGSIPKPASLSLTSIHNPHSKSLIDTAKMLWLQQIAANTHSQLIARQNQSHKKIAKKRKLGRNPRIPFTQQQIDCLEKKYSDSRYLSSLDVVALSKDLDLSEARVKIWFQNRRARERRDKRVDFCAATCTAAEEQTSSHIVLPASTAPGQNTDTDKAIVSPHNSSAGNMWSCPGSIFHAHHSILQHHQMKATTSHDDRKQTSLQQQVKDERIGNIMSYDDSDHIN